MTQRWTDHSFFDDVKEFHRAFGLRIGVKPELPNDLDQALRVDLILEETKELIKAHVTKDLVEVADAIADLIYVACGMAVAYGIPLNEVWAEVQRSNMAKLGPNGKAIYREDGKVLKPVNWTPPNIEGVLNA